MSDLTLLGAAETAAVIASGEVSARDVASAHLDRIEQTDAAVHAFLHVDRDFTLAQAGAVDQARSDGAALGALAGVPLALKDVFTMKGAPTTCGSKILEGWRPPYDSTVVERLKAGGIVVLGKTNMDEFAMGSSTENSAYGVTRNPWNLDRIPGGSSGGSSAAVAARQAPLAIGTDTGGSIRQPAAVTGIVGVKPTYGGVSRYGLVAFSSSLDQGGPLARSVLDAALLHEVIAGHDPRDATSIEAPVPPVVAAARGELGGVAGMKVGIVAQLQGEGYQPGVQARFAEVVELLTALGAEVVEVSCPSFDYALPAYYLIAPSECSSNLARFDGMRYGLRAGDDGENGVEQVMAITRAAGFGPEVKRRIMLGTYALSAGYYDAYYGQAQKVRTLIRRDFESAYAKVDVLLSPTTPTVAFPIGERADDPIAMYKADLATLPSSLYGGPAMSLPAGLGDDDLPVGVQLMAAVQRDEQVYRVGAVLEATLQQRWGGSLLDRVPELATGGAA
ncbi:MAG: Asp-tRNA(Asn)/Glu-tRNA(Gln) amidotransferase subunit GatA [Actinomycetia bacterium]|nr:Asp-tRNA(Asn)/Glu-tRNA(Gln) amidotransferase subunit GatA [Actinomycetes bacterium]